MSYQDIEDKARLFYNRLQTRGIPVSEEVLEYLRRENEQGLDRLLSSVEQKVGFRPNPNRQDDYAQVARMMGCELPKTPTGTYRTDEYTIERFCKKVPELAVLQQARRVRRKVSILTNLKAAAKQGRIYPDYVIHPGLGRTHSGGAANPMNFSKEEQTAVQQQGYQILVADYSRIEPKVLAVLSGDSQLQMDLSRDPYLELARTAFNVENPTPAQRNQAKTAFLAMLYGTTSKGLAVQLGIRDYQAQKIMTAWHRRYPTASLYMEELRRRGRQYGYAESYHGRRTPLNKPIPEANDRLAVNSVIQNTAGDLSRIGFVNVENNLELAQMGVRVLTTVHDSLVMLVPQDADLERIASLVRREMVEGNDPKFGLSVEFSVGPSWASVKLIRS